MTTMRTRFARTTALALFFTCAGTVPAMAQEPATPATGKTVENYTFHKSIETWRAAGQALHLAIEAPQDPTDPHRWAREVKEAARKSSELLDETVDAAVAALRAHHDDDEAREYLVFMLDKLDASDRLEELIDAGSALFDSGTRTAKVVSLLVNTAVDLGEVDSARKYLRVAADEKLFEVDSATFGQLDELEKVIAAEEEQRRADAAADNLPRVRFVTTQGDMVIELFEDQAPNTVANFLFLIDRSFYEGLEFFRVSSGFGATVGCLANDGTRGPGYDLPLETENNRRPHMRGTLSMVSAGNASHGSQVFFDFRFKSAQVLSGKQPVFGRVLEGLDVLCRLQRCDPRDTASPLPPDRVLDVQVVRKRDHEYVPVTSARDALLLVESAVAKAAEGQSDVAYSELEQAVQMAPQLFEAQFAMGMLLVGMRRGGDAAKYLARAVEIRPNHAEARFHYGVLLANQRRAEDAIVQFKEAIRYDPKDVRAYNNLATLLAGRKRVDEAIAILQRALEINPNYGPAMENLAKLREVLERTAK